MNDDTSKGVTAELPAIFDLSHGSDNTYLIEMRHRLIPRCIHCGTFRPIKLDGTEYYMYFIAGKFRSVAEAFPHNTSAEHELLMTGIHPDCWDAIFKEDDDA